MKGWYKNPKEDLPNAVRLVQDYIDRNGAASKRELLRYLKKEMYPETLDKVLYTLSEIRYLQTVTIGNVMYYKITPSLKKGDPNA